MSMRPVFSGADPGEARGGAIKVVVWDLDGTIWDGTLSEGDVLRQRPDVATVLRELDRKGVIHSIASRNEARPALQALKTMGLDEYFVFPAFSWGRKVEGLREISKNIAIGLGAFLLVDDQQFELDEVRHSLPEVRTCLARDVATLLSIPEFVSIEVTSDGASRRQFYTSEMARRHAEAEFVGSSEEFVATLGMVLSLRSASHVDLARASELTARTSQLNATGQVVSEAELAYMIDSPVHDVIVAELRDRYGDYGVIGLCARESATATSTIKTMVMSCRILSRGVPGLVLGHIVRRDQAAGHSTQAEFRDTGANRAIKIAYALAGFRVKSAGPPIILEHDGRALAPTPNFVKIHDQVAYVT